LWEKLFDYLESALPYLLGFFLLFSGIRKIQNFDFFLNALAGYRLVPNAGIGVIAYLVIIVEIYLGVGLFVKGWRRMAAILTALMFLVFAMVVGYEYLSGSTSNCGCMALLSDDRIGVRHVIQNILLSFLSWFVFFRCGQPEQDVPKNLQLQ